MIFSNAAEVINEEFVWVDFHLPRISENATTSYFEEGLTTTILNESGFGRGRV